MFLDILQGFEWVLSPTGLMYVFLGVFVGMVVGVLPGLGPAPAIALLLPMTYGLAPEQAIVLLAGIYYGSMYGGTITSVLLSLPGESASVVTVIDGNQMARQGRGGLALGIAAVGSFIGACVALIGLTLLAAPLAELAVKAGPPEYAALILFGLLLVVYLGNEPMMRSVIAAGIGLLIATIGLDPVSTVPRFTFGVEQLYSGGFGFVPIVMGLFGIGEVLLMLERKDWSDSVIRGAVSRVWPTREIWVQSRWSIARGSVLGFFIGVLPGGGGVVSSLASYGLEKRRAKDPSRFGRGAVEGVAGPETANNASSTSAFIPLLTLGIPSNVVMALIFGALLLHGITPGPALITLHPTVFWGVIASMYVGNALLLVMNVPFVRAFIWMLRVRVGILVPIVVCIVMVGVYSVNNSVFGMWVALGFGIVGYLMNKCGLPAAPLVLTLVLGPILERSVRQSLLLSGGDPSIFLVRPFSGSMLALGAGLLALSVFWRKASLKKHSRERYKVGL